MNLALKYRPTEFDQVVGQKATSVILAAMIAKQALSQVLLFTGPSGVGKTSMARIIAAQLNPEGAQDVREGSHMAVLEIDAASNGSVDAIRKLKQSLNYFVPGNRVVIIDEAHAMSPEAFAALLNLLEFPPKNVTIILITTESHKIPTTIRHRCDRYDFKKATVDDLAARLWWIAARENIVLTNDLVDLLAQRAEGSYREACMLLEQVWAAEITCVEEYNELQGEVDFGPSLVKSALTGPISALVQLESVLRYANTDDIADRLVETLKDVMILKAGIALTYSGDSLNSRLLLASKLDAGRLLKGMKIIWELQTKLSAGDPVRGLEMAVSMIGEVFQVAEPAKVVEQPVVDSVPMSLDAMKNFKG